MKLVCYRRFHLPHLLGLLLHLFDIFTVAIEFLVFSGLTMILSPIEFKRQLDFMALVDLFSF